MEDSKTYPQKAKIGSQILHPRRNRQRQVRSNFQVLLYKMRIRLISGAYYVSDHCKSW